MKKTITKEIKACDACGQEDEFPSKCLNCGVEYCHDCDDRLGVTYNHGVYFCGSGDGFYCNDCDQNLTRSGHDKVHNAYMAIKSLRLECDAWSSNFKKRQMEAELRLSNLTK